MLKKVGIVIIILVLIIVGLIFMMFNEKDGKKEIEKEDNNSSQHYSDIKTKEIPQKTLVKLEDEDKYFVLKKCIDTYTGLINKKNPRYYNINESNEMVYSKENELVINNEILDLLENNYKSSEEITVENITEKIDIFEGKVMPTILEVRVYKKDNIEQYFISCMFQDIKYNYLEERFIEVILDIDRKLFKIKPLDNIKNIDDIEIIKNIESIEDKKVNTYKEYMTNVEILSKEYLSIYKKIALGKPEYLYGKLDEDYKKFRFETLEEFKKFIEKNNEKIFSLRLEGYNEESYEGFNEYILKDQYDQYYRINEVNISDFSYILDDYTINSKQFIEKYNSSDHIMKSALNIERIKEAVNQQDYKYAYSKLDKTFKNTNFDTIDKFEQYMKENFYGNNKVEYTGAEEKGDYIIITAKIINQKNIKETKTKQFIVDLLEETDFVMSFNIE